MDCIDTTLFSIHWRLGIHLFKIVTMFYSLAEQQSKSIDGQREYDCYKRVKTSIGLVFQ